MKEVEQKSFLTTCTTKLHNYYRVKLNSPLSPPFYYLLESKGSFHPLVDQIFPKITSFLQLGGGNYDFCVKIRGDDRGV